MTLERLEYTLPITVQRREKKEMPCGDCKRHCEEAVNYEQRIYRNDDFYMGRKSRTYEISYVRQYSRGQVLLRTQRYHTLRNALEEAHKILDRLGLKSPEDEYEPKY